MGHFQLESTAVPFSATRQFLDAVLDADARTQLTLALRPITHDSAARDASLSDRQSPADQIRFYTRSRCMRDFRLIARELAARLPGGATIALSGSLNAADRDFFSILAPYWAVEITARLDGPDSVAARHPDLDRIRDGLRTDEDWVWLQRTLATYLSLGDSWTSVWLADQALARHPHVPPSVADVLGVGYGLQDRTGDSELLYRRWREAGGIDLARANYSLAMLYARHHPAALRDDSRATALLEEAWEVLRGLDGDDEQVCYEQVFNRNGIALILYRQRRHAEAIELLEGSIAGLSGTRFGEGLHHTVLANNLGRVYAAAGDPVRAERYLRVAVDLDPKFAEYWFDLASFYADRERFDDAAEAAATAEACSRTIADIPALRGYIAGRTGANEAAAEHYRRAWAVEPGHVQAALGAAHHLSELGRYAETRPWLDRLATAVLTDGQRESRDLLLLEADLNADPPLAGPALRDRMDGLVARYPASDTVRDNRALLLAGAGDVR
jgi:tetratricopeptide (TPR) repeat protein